MEPATVSVRLKAFASEADALAVSPSLIGMAGMGYGILSAALGINFVRLSWVLYRRPDDAAAKRLFAFSILYLFLLFLGLVVDKLVAISGLVAGL